jgi:hypothetical protein
MEKNWKKSTKVFSDRIVFDDKHIYLNYFLFDKFYFIFAFGCLWSKKGQKSIFFSFQSNCLWCHHWKFLKISISSFYFPINIMALQMQLYPILPFSNQCLFLNFASLVHTNFLHWKNIKRLIVNFKSFLILEQPSFLR